MTTMQLDSDEFMQLLTDALRAGPGSPQWHEVVGILGASGDQAAEYHAIVQAREHLASGIEYRSVRAGPGFTRKVMTQIDEAPPGRARMLPTATLVASTAVVVILAIVGAIVYLLWPGNSNERAGEVDRLAAATFVHPLVSSDFDLPRGPEFIPLGALPLDFTNGLKLLRGGPTDNNLHGGGVRFVTPLPADRPFLLEATLQINRTTDDIVPQVFVTDSDLFDPDLGVGSHELVWRIQNGAPVLALPDRTIAGQGDKIRDKQLLRVRIRIGRDAAVVDSTTVDNAVVNTAANRLYAGPHQLAATPRYAGVRILRRGTDKTDVVTIRSFRVMTEPEEK